MIPATKLYVSFWALLILANLQKNDTAAIILLVLAVINLAADIIYSYKKL